MQKVFIPQRMPRFKTLPLFIALAATLLFGIPAASAKDTALVAYGFGPASGPLLDTPASTAAGVTATPISYGTDDFAAKSGATFGKSNANALGLLLTNKNVPASVDDAIAAGAFVTFQLTPDKGCVLEISSVTFSANISGNTSLARYYALQIGANSNFTTIDTGAIITQGATTPGQSILVSVPGYTKVSTALIFRLVFYDPNNAGTKWSSSTRLDDITVNGAISGAPSGYKANSAKQ